LCDPKCGHFWCPPFFPFLRKVLSPPHILLGARTNFQRFTFFFRTPPSLLRVLPGVPMSFCSPLDPPLVSLVASSVGRFLPPFNEVLAFPSSFRTFFFVSHDLLFPPHRRGLTRSSPSQNVSALGEYTVFPPPPQTLPNLLVQFCCSFPPPGNILFFTPSRCGGVLRLLFF